MHTYTHITGLIITAATFTGCATSSHHLIEKERNWADAMHAQDRAVLEEIMAPDFRLTFEEIPPFMLTVDNGNSVPGTPRWRWIANTEAMSFETVEMYNMQVVEITEDLAAVNMIMNLPNWAEPDGTIIPPLYEVTDIWLNRDGTWRAITRYSRPLPADTQLPTQPTHRITK